MKLKLLVVVDNHEWAMSKRAKAVLEQMPGVDATVVPARSMEGKKRPDTKNFDALWCAGYASFVREPPSIPWIWTVAGEGERLANILDRCPPWGWRASAIFVQTFKGLTETAKYTRGDIPLLLTPHGVDSAFFTPAKVRNSVRMVGMAANVSDAEKAEHKGLMYAKEGSAAARVEFKLAPCFPIEERLTLKQMPGFYQALWAYCQPSISEGGSNTLMEAMSCGLPCLICKGVGYHGEVCRDAREHEDGEVLFVERSIRSVKETLIRLRRDGDLYRRMRLNARTFAKQHPWAGVASRMEDVFRYITMGAEKPE